MISPQLNSATGETMPPARGSFQAALVSVAALVLLGACSTVPEDQTAAQAFTDFVPSYDVVPKWYRQSQKGFATDADLVRVAIDDGNCYFVDTTGYITALDARRGRRVWRMKPETPPELRTPAMRLSGALGTGAGMLVAGTHDGAVLALDAADGHLRWRVSVSSEVLAPPVIAGNDVIVHSNDGRIFSLDAADGRRLWVYDGSVPALSLRGSSRPLVAEGKVIAGLDNGKVVALALGDGQVEWEMTVAVPEGRSELERLVDIDADPLYLDGVVYVAAYNGRVVAVSMLSGRVLWSRDISSYSSMAVSGDIIVVSGSDGTVWGLDRSSGAVMWRQDQLEGRALTAPAVQNGQFAIADDQGFVHWLAPRDGAFVARSHLDDVGITSIVSVDDILYTVSKAAELHAVKIRARARPPE